MHPSPTRDSLPLLLNEIVEGGVSSAWGVSCRQACTAVGLVLLWRSVWILADEWLYRHRRTLSACVGGVLGLALLLIVGALPREW